MKSYAIGVVVAGVAAWYGTQEARAQVITITGIGTTAITTDTTTIQVDAGVSGYNDYYFRAWFYLNGVQKKDSGTLCYAGSVATYYAYNTGAWGMRAGDQMRIRIRVWLTSTIYDMEDHYVTVGQGGMTYLRPADAPDRTPAGAAPALHAAVIRSEEELLA